MNGTLKENNSENNFFDDNIFDFLKENYTIDELLELYIVLLENTEAIEPITVKEIIQWLFENNQLKAVIDCGDIKINYFKEELKKIIYQILSFKIGTDLQEEIEGYKKKLSVKKEYIIFETKLMKYYDFLYGDSELVRAFDLFYNDYYKYDVISEFLQNIEFDYTELSEEERKEYEESLVQIKIFKQKEDYTSTIYDIEKSQTIHYVFNFMFMPIEDQKRLLLTDPKYEELRRLCSKTFLLLRKLKKGEITGNEIPEEKERILKEAEKLCIEVKPYNKQAAITTYDIIKAYFKKMGYGENLWDSKKTSHI